MRRAHQRRCDQRRWPEPDAAGQRELQIAAVEKFLEYRCQSHRRSPQQGILQDFRAVQLHRSQGIGSSDRQDCQNRGKRNERNHPRLPKLSAERASPRQAVIGEAPSFNPRQDPSRHQQHACSNQKETDPVRRIPRIRLPPVQCGIRDFIRQVTERKHQCAVNQQPPSRAQPIRPREDFM